RGGGGRLEVVGGVGVGGGAQLRPVVEAETLRVRRQGCDDAQPGLLVDDAVQAVVSEAPRRVNRFVLVFRHRCVPMSSTAPPPRTVGRRRTARPSPREITTPRPASGRTCPPPGKTRRPRTSPVAAGGARRRCPG